MITTTAEFSDATAYERFAIFELAPLVQDGGHSSSIDLRSRRISLSHVEDIAGSRISAAVSRFRPLGVGAAMKVIDLLVELGLNNAAPAPRDNYRFTEKALHAATGHLPPLSGDGTVWSRLCATYSSLMEQRHSVVHRSFTLDAAGAMTGMRASSGAPARDVSVDDQLSLMSTAQRAADAVIRGAISERHREDLLFHLDRLQVHHGLGPAGARQLRAIPRVITDAVTDGSRWTIEPDAVLREAQATFRSATRFDLELHFPNAGLAPLVGELETAPIGVQVVDPLAPPAWLRP